MVSMAICRKASDVLGQQGIRMLIPPDSRASGDGTKTAANAASKNSKARVLIVEDNPIISDFLQHILSDKGHEAAVAPTLAQAAAWLHSRPYDIVLLDLGMPDGSGLGLLKRSHQFTGSPTFIVLTGSGSPEDAEEAIRAGASDYLVKPPNAETILHLVLRHIQCRSKRAAQAGCHGFLCPDIIGDSRPMHSVIEVLSKAARCRSSLLITGETGTGKEVCARCTHGNSDRGDMPLVVVDCTNIPHNLAESLLFGHLKGSFTGATEDRDGFFKEADKSTIFLDEVGDLSLPLQKTLLRVLQERTFRPVGSRVELSSDFRVIAATNKNLRQMMEQKRFRRDLYFRLRAIHVHLPPLMQRAEDIPKLVAHFMPRVCREAGVAPMRVSKDALALLLAYSWPGNIRELLNVLVASVANSFGESMVHPHNLPVEIRVFIARSMAQSMKPAPHASESAWKEKLDVSESGDHTGKEYPTYKEWKTFFKKKYECQYLQQLLTKCDNDINKASKISKLSRARVYQLIKEHGIIKT